MLYKDSGVDIDGGNEFVRFIKSKLKKSETFYPDFALTLPLGDILKKYNDPYLVYSTDGIGTKIKLAIQYNNVKYLGQDLVAMCVNDILVLGAKPLVFLDYIAISDIKSPYIKPFMEGLLSVLEREGIELGGGETAELPDLLNGDEFDVAGFIIGIAEKSKIPHKEWVKDRDVIIAFPSSGIHSNGYSLVRAILKERKINPENVYIEGKKLINVLLTPTTIYTKKVLGFFKDGIVHGAAHITGGGLYENIRRTLNKNVDAVIYRENLRTPAVFKYLQEMGNIPDDEMFRVFNMGVGFVIIVSEKDEDKVLEKSADAWVIGRIVKGTGKVVIK